MQRADLYRTLWYTYSPGFLATALCERGKNLLEKYCSALPRCGISF